MSYSALTDLGVAPICPTCKLEIKDGQVIVLALLSQAVHSPSYNAENGMLEKSITVEFDWTDQNAYHEQCVAVFDVDERAARIDALFAEADKLTNPGEYGLGSEFGSIPDDDKKAWERVGQILDLLRKEIA